MMPFNKRFTNRVTRSVLEIRSPHFYARPSQARAVRKGSDFVFPSTDRVTRLVNRYNQPHTGFKNLRTCSQIMLAALTN